MKLYVDGNDLLDGFRGHESEVLVAGDRMKSRLNAARWLARFAEQQDCDVVLVWDENRAGTVLPPTERHGRVRVVNLPEGAEAMHEIAGPANREAETDRVHVVTDDPRLMEALAHGGARAFDPQRFLERARTILRGGDEAEGFDEPDEKFSGLSDEEVEFWKEFFREDGQ